MADLLSVGKPVGDELPVKFPGGEGQTRYFFVEFSGWGQGMA